MTLCRTAVPESADGTFLESGALAGVAFDNKGDARGAMGVERLVPKYSVSWFCHRNFATEMTALYVCQNPGKKTPIFRDEAVSNGIGRRRGLN